MPIELLVLGSLRYMARSWTFDDFQEVTGISKETYRIFFHKLIEWGSQVFYKEMVEIPASSYAAEDHMREFSLAGLDGCIGSTDATHVPMDRCPYDFQNIHKSPKSGVTC